MIPIGSGLGETGRRVVILTAWSMSLATISGQALLREAFLGPVDLALLLGVSLLAGALLSDLVLAVMGYLVSAIVAFVALYVVFLLPSVLGYVGSFQAALVEQLWLGVMVRAFFPFPFIGLLIASILGAALGEKYS